MENTFRKIVFLIVIAFCFSCNSKYEKREQEAFTFVSELKSGDIILRLCHGIVSEKFRTQASRCGNADYSHSGILYLKNDSVFVIHTFANEFTGTGTIECVTLNKFLETYKSFAIYRFSEKDSISQKITNKSLDYLSKDVKFDLTFNSYNDSELYCTELIANCLNTSFSDSILTIQKSKYGINAFCIDDIYTNEKAKLIYKYPEN